MGYFWEWMVLLGVEILMAVVVVPIFIRDHAGIHAVLGVVDLAWKAVHSHALLRCPLVCSHLQGYGLGVAVLHTKLLLEDLPLGAWSRHAGLGRPFIGAHL